MAVLAWLTMEARTLAGPLAGALALGLIVLGFGLFFWLSRFRGRVRAEYQPPAGIAGPLGVLRLDYYSSKGRMLIAKAACCFALLSFIFVAGGLLAAAFPSSSQAPRPGAAVLPPETFFLAASAISFSSALLAGLVLMLAAAAQLGWAMLRPSTRALRLNAARFAIYGVGAFLLAIAHTILLRVGLGLLY